MVRKLENWIEQFCYLTNVSGAPEIFRVWSGISAVAAALERRVWVDVGLGPLYPNMYVILVSPPGIGKTELTSRVWNILDSLSTGAADGLQLAPSSMTAASVIDALRDAERKFYTPGNFLDPMLYNSLAIVSNELGTLLPAYDPEMMNRLTDIYDCKSYSERRRTRELNFKINNPQINFLAGTTPGHLTNSLPEGAWDQGFLSRTLMIFNSERVVRPLFQTKPNSEAEWRIITNDLTHIFNMAGEFKFSPSAANSINAWHLSGGQPAPDHPRLRNYNTRRTAHLLKLCIVASASVSDSQIIELEHFQRALDWLIEAEVMMPDIFKAMVINADMKAIEECWHFAYAVFIKEQQPVAEHRLVAFLTERVPVQNVMKMLQMMEASRILDKKLVGDVGYAYQPKPRKPGF